MRRPLAVLALSGLSPAVVTETLWALLAAGETIGSVTIVSTARGADLARSRLLGENGRIAALWSALGAGRLPPVDLVVLRRRKGGALDDLASIADHLAATDAITALVRDLTGEGRPPLHASIAGGRKTMGAALTLAMTLYARPQDRLSHVLVDAALERDPSFFFPGERAAAHGSGVHLAEVPFPRLRLLLPASTRDRPTTRLIAELQARLDDEAVIELDLAGRVLRTPAGQVPLSPLLCAVYGALALQAPLESLGIEPAELDSARLGKLYRQAGASTEKVAALLARLRSEDPQPWFLEQVARLRARLAVKLGTALAAQAGVMSTGRRPRTRYRLALPRSRIRIKG
ncbi:MAG TPA: CRISPR-associated ring nuclease Csm6 [Dongiaceae bacterium]|nr:CRISPR-associated ring nuclease Csm6 [Dongiaceae bacterium]